MTKTFSDTFDSQVVAINNGSGEAYLIIPLTLGLPAPVDWDEGTPVKVSVTVEVQP